LGETGHTASPLLRSAAASAVVNSILPTKENRGTPEGGEGREEEEEEKEEEDEGRRGGRTRRACRNLPECVHYTTAEIPSGSTTAQGFWQRALFSERFFHRWCWTSWKLEYLLSPL